MFGPAARSLPQLPLEVDDDGLPRRHRRLPEPVGPGFWDRGAMTPSRTPDAAHPAGPLARRAARARPSFARTALNKVFPDHWSFMLGEVALYCFVVLVAHRHLPHVLLRRRAPSEVVYHGSYAPLQGVTMSQAYESALELSFDVRAGLVMRQIHHWAALLFLGAIVVHLCRVFFTGAFRRPREINWIIGVTLLILAIVNGFAGYSLLDDQLSGTGPAHRLLDRARRSRWSARGWRSLLFGGEFPGDRHHHAALRHPHPARPGADRRRCSARTWRILVRQKHTQFRGPGRQRGQRRRRAAVADVHGQGARPVLPRRPRCCAAARRPGPDQPDLALRPVRPGRRCSSASQPDWYMGWLEGALRLMPAAGRSASFGYEIPNPFFPAVLLPGVTFRLLYAWPFLEAPVHQATARSTTCSTGPATARCAPRSAWPTLSLLHGARSSRAATTSRHHVRPVGER